MQTQFAAVNKTVTTVTANYDRLDRRLVIVERDMGARIAAHNQLQANLTETASQLHDQQALLTKNVQASSQRLTSLKTEYSKQLESINKHLGELEEDVNQVNSHTHFMECFSAAAAD
jgi:hypothetical protein